MEDWSNKLIPLGIHERERVLINCKAFTKEWLAARHKKIKYDPKKNQIGLNL